MAKARVFGSGKFERLSRLVLCEDREDSGFVPVGKASARNSNFPSHDSRSRPFRFEHSDTRLKTQRLHNRSDLRKSGTVFNFEFRGPALYFRIKRQSRVRIKEQIARNRNQSPTPAALLRPLWFPGRTPLRTKAGRSNPNGRNECRDTVSPLAFVHFPK